MADFCDINQVWKIMTSEERLENVFMSYLRKIPDDLKPGEKREVSCPCGGTLLISCSKLNKDISKFILFSSLSIINPFY